MALIDLLPENYKKSQEVIELQKGFDHKTEELKLAKEDLFNQFFVNTATWGLTAWEKALGVDTDLSKSYTYRRERIKAKLRGSGTTTKAMIKQVAEAFSNGEVEIIEDPANYHFTIKFVGTLGIPANMKDLTLTIEEIKPVHLSYDFYYIYRTHVELSPYTYGQLSQYTNKQLREETLT